MCTLWNCLDSFCVSYVHIFFTYDWVSTVLRVWASSRNIKVQWWLCTAAFISKIGERCSTTQCSLSSPDPLDQSCTADLSLFSLFILSTSASTCFRPSASSCYPPSLLPFPPLSFSALSLLICVEMFWCSCCQRQHSQGTAPWETCKSVSLSTHPCSFLFSLLYSLGSLNNVSRLFHLCSLILAIRILSTI